jgi:hypothetical protein
VDEHRNFKEFFPEVSYEDAIFSAPGAPAPVVTFIFDAGRFGASEEHRGRSAVEVLHM